MKQYNNRWFLFGYYSNTQHIWNIALDRIEKVDETNEKYTPNNEIDWSEYFEDIVGVTKPENVKAENIILHFYGTTGKYIESKPIHGSQKSKWIDSNTLEVQLDLIINYEITQMILSYAECVKVIKPASLVGIVKDRLQSGVLLYL